MKQKFKTQLNPLNGWMKHKKTNNNKNGSDDDTIPNLSKFNFDKKKNQISSQKIYKIRSLELWTKHKNKLWEKGLAI